MKLNLVLLFFVFISCKEETFKKEYFPNGNEKVRKQVNSNGILDGYFEEFYESGELKLKTKYSNGVISDTVYIYYRNKNLKEKGKIKNNLKFGWWFYYDSNGKLKSKEEYLILKDSMYKNQTINYDSNGNIIQGSSSYFNLILPDTLQLGRNIGDLDYHSNFSKTYKKFLDVIIENEYSEKNIKKDTFRYNDETPYFGVFAYKMGKNKIKGTILETLFYVNETGNDSALGRVVTHKKYFEKEVFVKDTVPR